MEERKKSASTERTSLVSSSATAVTIVVFFSIITHSMSKNTFDIMLAREQNARKHESTD